MAKKDPKAGKREAEHPESGELLSALNSPASSLKTLSAKARDIRKNGHFADVDSNGDFIGRKKTTEPKSPQKRLIKAIEKMSVEDAKKAIADGADPWITTFFYGDCGVFGEEAIAQYDQSEVVSARDWPDDGIDTTSAWAKGVKKTFKKNPEAVMAMAFFLEELGSFTGRETGAYDWQWREGVRPQAGQAPNRDPGLVAKERRKMLVDWCQARSWSDGWSEAGNSGPEMKSALKSALISVVKRWHEEPEAVGGLPAMEWREIILDSMASDQVSTWGDSWEMLANFSKELGEPLAAKEWERALAHQGKVSGLAYVQSWVKVLLKIQRDPINPAETNRLMALAVGLNDVEMLGLIANKALGSDWVENCVSQNTIGNGLTIQTEEEEPVSILALGLLAPRRVSSRGKVFGRECFEALASIPEAVAAAIGTPSPSAMQGVDEQELAELVRRFPGIEAPDREGNNAAHWWARAINNEKALRKRFIRLLNSSMAHLATTKNNDGETPLAIFIEELSERQRGKWNKDFARWEAEKLCGSAAAAAPSRGKKTSL